MTTPNEFSEQVFGTIITEEYPRKALIDHIRLWSPAYLEAVAYQMDITHRPIPPFASYDPVDEGVTIWPEDHLPACVVVVGGLPQPQNKGGRFYGSWLLGAGVVVSGQDNVNARQLVALYTAAVRACVLQHPSLGGKASGVEFMEESYNDLRDATSRTLKGGRVLFNVHVDGLVDANSGPSAVPNPVDDVPALHTAATVSTRIERLP